MNVKYLLPVTIFFLIVAVAILGYKAQRRRGYGPFWLGLLAAIAVITGKFWINLALVMYSGVFFLIIASLWNAWPSKQMKGGVDYEHNSKN